MVSKHTNRYNLVPLLCFHPGGLEGASSMLPTGRKSK